MYAYCRTATFLAVIFKRPTLEGPTWKGQHLSSCSTPSIWPRLSDEGDISRSSVRWRSSWKVNVNFQSKVKEKANTIVAVKNPYQLCWYYFASLFCFVIKTWLSSSQVFCINYKNNLEKKLKLQSNLMNYLIVVLCFFSSPEHEVLMVSYCGQWLSVVRRRVSSVVRRPSCVNIW